MKLLPLPPIHVSTTLTLENIPVHLYARLERSAAMHRRSLEREAIACLEVSLRTDRRSSAERLQRIRRLRAELPQMSFDARDIDALRTRGRP
jgi:plasmid stability protein